MFVLLAGRQAHGVLLDLGVSSMQLSSADRGFSLREEYDGPLDMRMDRSTPITAANVVNMVSEVQLRTIIKTLGGEPRASGIARAIVTARKEDALQTTSALARVIAKAKRSASPSSTHPATQTFQALRIFINNELHALRRALVASERLLVCNGVVAALTYHSGEAQVWKDFIRITKKGDGHDATVSGAKALAASEAEIAQNPRARSAHLRYAFRTAALAKIEETEFLQMNEEEAEIVSWRRHLEQQLLTRKPIMKR